MRGHDPALLPARIPSGLLFALMPNQPSALVTQTPDRTTSGLKNEGSKCIRGLLAVRPFSAGTVELFYLIIANHHNKSNDSRSNH
jgi:hypothetical protein